MIADAAEPCRVQRLPADAGVTVRGHDQVGVRRDLRGCDEFGVRLHDNPDPRGLGSTNQPILCVVYDDPGDIDTAFTQHVQGCHAKMAGADKGNPHGFIRQKVASPPVDSMSVRLSREGHPLAAVINRGGAMAQVPFSRVASALSMRRPSRSTISNCQPLAEILSPTSGMVANSCSKKPANVW